MLFAFGFWNANATVFEYISGY